MNTVQTDHFSDVEPAVSWVISENASPSLHFLPTFWAMVQTLSVMKKEPVATQVVVDMLVEIVKSHTVLVPNISPTLSLGWQLGGDNQGDETEAVLSFFEGAIPIIAGLWEKSIDDTRDIIAEELIQTVCRAHGPVGHA